MNYNIKEKALKKVNYGSTFKKSREEDLVGERVLHLCFSAKSLKQVQKALHAYGDAG